MNGAFSVNQRPLDWMLRLLLGGAFVVAGGLKIAEPAKFALAVGNYRLLPHEWTNLVAILLPWIEVTAGLFVLAGFWLRAAALVLTGLTAIFFLVILSALGRGLNIDCGCFGTVGGRHVGLVNLAIDSALFLLAVTLVARSRDGVQTHSSLKPVTGMARHQFRLRRGTIR